MLGTKLPTHDMVTAYDGVRTMYWVRGRLVTGSTSGDGYHKMLWVCTQYVPITALYLVLLCIDSILHQR